MTLIKHLNQLTRFFSINRNSKKENNTMKYLIAGLGNIGSEYAHTRHNIGFDVVDEMAKAASVEFKEQRYGMVAYVKHKGRTFVLLKPSTYMNLSGKAINYWLIKEKLNVSNLLVVVDDLALDFGTLRLKPQGSDAGHNGLKNINSILSHNKYARLRFGIGNNYSKGKQIDYVLGKWTTDEQAELPERIDIAIDMIKSFGTIGVQQTMNQFNNKK